MRVLGRKILLSQTLSDTKTPGGLALPDTMQTKLPVGSVVAVGSDAFHLGVRTGMIVQFNGYAGSDVSVGGTPYVVIDTDDVLVIEEGTDSE